MFEMRGLFLRFFKLILRVALKLTLDIIYRRAKVAKVLLQKNFKLNPGYRN